MPHQIVVLAKAFQREIFSKIGPVLYRFKTAALLLLFVVISPVAAEDYQISTLTTLPTTGPTTTGPTTTGPTTTGPTTSGPTTTDPTTTGALPIGLGTTSTATTLASFNHPSADRPWISSACEQVSCGEDFGDALIDTGFVLELFGGLDGSKQPQDFGVNANFGGRVSANLGLPIADTGFGLQLGTALNASENAVQVFERVDGPTTRQQSFTTIGLFRRTTNWTAAVGYDILWQDSYDEFLLGQWRAMFGIPITDVDEVGIWGTLRSTDDQGAFGATPLTLRPISQGSFYWRHQWETGVRTTFWAGLAGRHGEVNLALGDLSPVGENFVFGSDLHVPLNDRCAIYGEANFLAPADTGTVDAYLGLVIYLDPIAKVRDRSRYAPVLPVANSTSFAVDLRR